MKNWPILKPFISLLFSRKFLVLFVVTLASSGVAWAANLEAFVPLIVMLGGTVMTTLTAWEDANAKRGVEAQQIASKVDNNE